MSIKRIIRKILYPNTYSSEAYKNYLLKKGCQVGKGTFFYSPKTTTIDVQNGCFIEIGEYCKITQGVVILAHDFSFSIMRRTHHEILKKAAITKIGDNCFIGLNSIILMGAEIGNNCIIGAGSVVSGKVPDNQVWAGNPAKFICTIEDYYKKCRENYEKGAFITIKQYQKRYNRYPNIQELQYYSSLFYEYDELISEYRKMSFHADDKEEVIHDLMKHKRKYRNIDDFVKCMEKTGEN